MRILAIPGSLRAHSFNRRLLVEAAQLAPAPVRFGLWGSLRDVPPFDEDAEAGSPPEAVASLRSAIGDSDAVLIATPEYNGSVPGALKNALDWASRPFTSNVLRGKPVAVIGASPSPGGARHAQADLRRVLRVIGADPVDTDLAVTTAHRRFDRTGRLTDVGVRQRLAEEVQRLLAHVEGTPLAPTG